MNDLTKKIITIVVIICALLVGIGMISSLIHERATLKKSVEQDIAKSSVQAQTLAAPVITFPYIAKFYDREKSVYRQIENAFYFFPEQLTVNGNLTTEERYRGIYKVNLYTFKGQLTAEFVLPENPYSQKDEELTYEFGEPYIALKISDIRGIGNSTSITLNGQQLKLLPLGGNGYLGEGVKGQLSPDMLNSGESIKFNVDLELKGTSALSFIPVGKDTRVTLSGAWPHPSFSGNALPKDRTIDKQAFTASWEVSKFANITPKVLGDCWSSKSFNCSSDKGMSSFGVDLVDTVDQYRKSYRAVKYGILFVGLTFIGFFVFEVVRRINIHGVQYSLVGFALVLFFLLLISLSEHIGFLWAYVVAAIACIGLITYYLYSILRDKKVTLLFSGLLTSLYVVLYILLNGEEYSLVLGSILLFLVMGAMMILTRNVDWNELSQRSFKKSKES